MMNVGSFSSQMPIRRGDKVIVRTERGTELGEVVTVFDQVVSSEDKDTSEVSQEAPAAANTDAEPGAEQAERQPAPLRPAYGPRVLRKATKEDLAKSQEIKESMEPAQFKFCQQKIRELQVPMRLAAVEHLFGGEKVIFYFLAESRVDFRSLVRELAREYRTRIEMKQIGARDEAKLLGDYEHCGHELCCRGFIRTLEPVTIKMAKSQKATLDPAKISGACGRLMCCLRFENPIYQLLKSQLPRKGKRVKTPQGEGEVINYDIIAQTVLVEESTGEKITYKANELSWGSGETAKAQEQERANDSAPSSQETRSESDESAPAGESGGRRDSGSRQTRRRRDSRSRGGRGQNRNRHDNRDRKNQGNEETG
jgi:cell fate regulator YaaT (PSP1 superfamily)